MREALGATRLPWVFTESTFGYGVGVPDDTMRPTAEPITAVIAERVRTLRTQRGMSQEALAHEVAKRGPKWKRATVVNLEKRASSSRGAQGSGRDSVTGQELIALAMALGVPLAWLLADPKSDSLVPLAHGEEPFEVAPWAALLWAGGRAPLGDVDGAWLDAEVPLQQAAAIHNVVEQVQSVRKRAHLNSMLFPEQQDAEAEADAERRLLHGLIQPMKRLIEQGYRLPVLPDEVVDLALELDVALPTVEG